MGRRKGPREGPPSDVEIAKHQLLERIARTIRDRQLTQWNASVIMHVDQPQVSHILSGHASVSLQRLLEFLNALGQDVTITIASAPRPRRRGRIHVAR